MPGQLNVNFGNLLFCKPLVGRSKKITELEDNVKQLKDDVTAAKPESEDWKQKIVGFGGPRGNELLKQVEDLIEEFVGTKPPDHDAIAQDWWISTFSKLQEKDKLKKDKLKKNKKEDDSFLDDMIKEPFSISNKLAKDIVTKKWQKDLWKIKIRAKPWFSSVEELKPAYHAAVERPWEQKRMDAVRKQLDVLEEAGKAWDEWAKNENFTFEDLQKTQVNLYSPPAQVILKVWLAQVDGRSEWTLRPISGTAGKGKGTFRRICVYEPEKVYSLDHQWRTKTKHTYSEHEIKFKWKPDEPFRIILEGEWSYYYPRPDLIDKTFKGPLAVYRAHRQGLVQNDDKTITFEYEIVDCPGPPR